MIVMNTILVPTDFSETSETAVKYGRALAGAFGASLHILHVMESPLYLGIGSEAYVPLSPDFVGDLERYAHDQLNEVLSEADREQLRAELVLKAGSPFVEILRYAKSVPVDLIVMGTHGRGPVAHMLMGSVAEKVVRKAPCPVLTVRHPQHEFVMP